MKHWRVILSQKLWNQEKFERLFTEQPEIRRLAQSKGKCKMKILPVKGDSVSFVFKGKIVMKGIVDSETFETGIYHQNHSCNLGTNREHAEPKEFIWVQIQNVGLSIDIPPSGQRTWAQLKNQKN